VRGARWLLGLAALLVSVAIAEVGLRLVSFDARSDRSALLDSLEGAYYRLTQTPHAVGIWQYDPVLGYAHIPNSSGRDYGSHGSFDVVYTIDAGQRRMAPSPPSPAMTVAFLGGSTTFGHGVADAEAYPAVLGSAHWPEVRVENHAVNGWGTVHAYVRMQQLLAAPDRPDVFVYGAIPHHVRRNYLSREWLESILTVPQMATGEGQLDRRGHPHFELSKGRLVSHGIARVEDSVPTSPRVMRKELKLTTAYLAEMQGMADEGGVGFAVVLLPSANPWPPLIVATLQREGIPYLDLSSTPVERIPRDGHPGSTGHAAIARAIAKWAVAEEMVRPEKPTEKPRL
jgi:hypothetical protein